MAERCPVCSDPLAEGAVHCPKCGFPTALLGRLDGSLDVPAEAEAETAKSPALRGTSRYREVGPETEVNASIARALEDRTELLRTLDHDAPDVTGELCEAALNEASGRVSDAQQVLRSAQGRLDRETEELLGRHLASLEARGRALQATGLHLSIDQELSQLADGLVASEPAASVAALLGAERRMDGIEAHWRGLQGLIAQVTVLQQEAGELGVDLSRLPDRLQEARARLANGPVGERDLDVVAQAAAETLMHLHEAIPPALEQELARHAGTIAAHPTHLPKHASARSLHAEAVRNLQSGRLQDAVQSLRELRISVDRLAEEAREAARAERAAAAAAAAERKAAAARAAEAAAARPAPVPPEPARAPAAPEPSTPGPTTAPTPPPAPAPPDAEMISTLVKKARSLAVRVRSLPADSAVSADAAEQIHRATELLRARQYAEADAALTRLMRTLAATAGGS